MSANTPIQQSAALPYRHGKNSLQILLVTSLDTGRWVLPKGHIDPGCSLRQAAAQEAFEEAGIEGKIAKECVGTYVYDKSNANDGDLRRVNVYPMTVSEERDDWPEKSKRSRQWMDVVEAIDAVEEKKLKKIIEKFGKQAQYTEE